jgi:hypothetical protein
LNALLRETQTISNASIYLWICFQADHDPQRKVSSICKLGESLQAAEGQ